MKKAGIFDQTFNGTVEWIGVRGGFFKLISAANGVACELLLDGQTVLSATAAPAGFYQRIEFDQVRITSPVNQEVSWLYGPDEGGADRLAGEVSVVDGGKARTLANTAFFGSAGSTVPAAGQYGVVQLKNPAGSNMRVVVKKLFLSVEAAGASAIGVARYNTDLANLVQQWLSKRADGLDGVAQLRYAVPAAPVAGAGDTFVTIALAANASTVVALEEPLVLPPGTGLIAQATTSERKILVGFEGTEEAAV